MDMYIPASIVENHILPLCDDLYLTSLIQQASYSGDHAFILETLYRTLQTKNNKKDGALIKIFMAYIIRHYTYSKIASIKEEFEIVCFQDCDDVVFEILKHPDDKVLHLFCAPCSVCASEMIPSAIWMNLSYRIWEAEFAVTPTLYDVVLMIQIFDRVGIEAFFTRLRHTPIWKSVLSRDILQYVTEMEKGHNPDTDATLGLLVNISMILRGTYRNKEARWVYKKIKYFQKLMNIDYFLETCTEYLNNIEDAMNDYDY